MLMPHLALFLYNYSAKSGTFILKKIENKLFYKFFFFCYIKMDTNLPSLDIVEDINVIMEDDEVTPEKVNQTIEEVEKQEEEDNSPFVQKPTKKKKELSEKQKAHLDRIRKIAFEKKKAKQEAKQQALDKINEEHKAKSYKPRKTKKTEEQKKYEERTVKIDIKEPREEKDIKTETPDDFVPSHKEKLAEQKKNEEANEKMSFINFMGNMEKYLIMRDDYERTKKQKAQPKPREDIKPPPKKSIVIPAPIQPPSNPFSSYFG
jgi:hypothetical protein